MWVKLHDRLKNYVPLMIGLGGIIIVIDALIFVLHSLVGLGKGAALYFSILLFISVSCLMFRQQLTAHVSRTDTGREEDFHCETSAKE